MEENILQFQFINKPPEPAQIPAVDVVVVLVSGVQDEVEVAGDHPRAGDLVLDRTELLQELNFINVWLRP